MTLQIDQNVCEATLSSPRHAISLEARGQLCGRDGWATAFYEVTNADASDNQYSFGPRVVVENGTSSRIAVAVAPGRKHRRQPAS